VSTFIENEAVREFFDIISLAVDRFDRPFVSVLEAKEYPIYCTMFHPEKLGFEWHAGIKGLTHDIMSIERAQYYADFFVQEAR
jgi:gamma-glutamyl hydrolase